MSDPSNHGGQRKLSPEKPGYCGPPAPPDVAPPDFEVDVVVFDMVFCCVVCC
jgi:hypothetical protein